jgi:hypothetical protein
MNRTLQIGVRYKRNDHGVVDFITRNNTTRINNLRGLRRFLGNLYQLSFAIDSECRQRCLFVLTNRAGLYWVLACSYNLKLVRLSIWNSDFYWQGSAMEFRNAIRIIN